jgi:hypothetical protein
MWADTERTAIHSHQPQGNYLVRVTVYDNGWPPKIARCASVQGPPPKRGEPVMDFETCKQASLDKAGLIAGWHLPAGVRHR